MMNKEGDLLSADKTAGGQKPVERHPGETTCDPNQRGPHGRTPVMVAALSGDQATFDRLISTGADTSLTDDDGNGLLCLAVLGRRMEIVQRLLNEVKLDLEVRGCGDRTVLMAASERGDIDMFKLLASRGADLTLLDADGNTCLHLAAKSGNTSLVRVMLKKEEVNVDARNRRGQTPVMLAMFEGEKEVFDLLASIGADLSLVDENSNDCLMLAVFSGQTGMVEQVLKTVRPNMNRKGEKGMTPAMMAASFGAKADFDLLLASGADVTLKNDFDNDFLFWAASGGNVEIVRYLLSLEIFEVDRKQEHGLTPLHIAITKGHEGVFDLLMSNGADTSLKNEQLYNSLMIASHTGNVPIAKKLLSVDGEIDGREENGWTPLMIASKCGHARLFHLLLASGADGMAKDNDSNNCLMLASIYSRPLMVQQLVEHTTLYDVDCRGMYGWTPLMAAANEGHAEVFEVLATAGADLQLLDDSGNNCLILACLGGNVDIVRTLVSANVLDLKYEGRDGSAIDAAVAEGHEEVVDLLVRNGAHARI